MNGNAGHNTITELLPWYTNGTLEPQERNLVAEHLAACPECREELAHYQQLSASIPDASDTDDWQPSASHFAQILSVIDAQESVAIASKPVPKKPAFWEQCRDWLHSKNQPLVWMLTVESIALATLVMFIVMPHFRHSASEQAVFQTLSDAQAPVASGLPRVHIVFADDMTIAEMRVLLPSGQSHIVDGPTKLGVYTLELAAATPTDSVNSAIAELRKHPKVKLAELVQPRSFSSFIGR